MENNKKIQEIPFDISFYFGLADENRHSVDHETINNLAEFIKSIFPEAKIQVKTEDGSCKVVLTIIVGEVIVAFAIIGGVAVYQHYKTENHRIDKEYELKQQQIANGEKGIDTNIQKTSPFIKIEKLNIGSSNQIGNNSNIFSKLIRDNYTYEAKAYNDISNNFETEEELKTFNNFVEKRNRAHKNIVKEQCESFKIDDEEFKEIFNKNTKDKFKLQTIRFDKKTNNIPFKTNISEVKVNVNANGIPSIGFTEEKEKEIMNNEQIKNEISKLKEEQLKNVPEKIKKRIVEKEKKDIKKQKKEELKKMENCPMLFKNV